MNEPIDIHEPVRQICELLGIEYEAVANVEVEPATAKVVMFRRNEDGAFHVGTDGKIAKDVRAFAVKT